MLSTKSLYTKYLNKHLKSGHGTSSLEVQTIGIQRVTRCVCTRVHVHEDFDSCGLEQVGSKHNAKVNIKLLSYYYYFYFDKKKIKFFLL